MNQNNFDNNKVKILKNSNNNIYKINDTYTILFNKKIGGGAFGKIYRCINNKKRKREKFSIRNKIKRRKNRKNNRKKKYFRNR